MSLETKIAESLRAWFSAQQESDPLLRSSSCERYVRDLELLAKVRAHAWAPKAIEMFREEADFLSYCDDCEGKVAVYRMLAALLSPPSDGKE